MSVTQRIAALIIATGLSLPLTSYGVNIRLSVFGERNGIWLLSDDFSTNIETQLARLRDALACKKRYISFPGDALYSLKEDWNKRFYQNQTKYTSVLISSLISSHAISNQVDWNKISNKIIVFGLKSQFEEKFKKKYNIYDDLLKMKPTNKNQIVQRFLDPLEIVCQEPSVRKPIEELCNSIVTSSIYESNDIFIFSLSNDLTNKEIQPQVIIDETSEKTCSKLVNMMKQPPKNKILQKSIENKSMDFTELIGNPDIFNLEGRTTKDDNPTEKAYHDGVFKGFKILIVFLYLGGYEYGGEIRDKNVTKEVFESGAGEALKRKGFEYIMVCSYGEAINELTRSVKGRCPYVETWIFSSSGDGSLPADATDNDTNKIIPFLKCIADFNNNGGGLLLFTDNDPYTFEINLLLKDYLKFDERPKFEMKGNYNEPISEKKYIRLMDDTNSESNGRNGRFKNEIKLPPPGKSQVRYSLRPGLIKFYEGITLSWAQCFDDKSRDYYPFIPFAYTTDKSNENPFILFYDPKMNESDVNQGPIVLHGEYTSAFYDFSLKGTGRLITNIACWLVRLEERINRKILSDDNILIKDIPCIPMPSYNGETFTKWINTKDTDSQYSILILDVSDSMNSYYQALINLTNKIIVNQNKNKQNKVTVIFFGSSAKTIIKESNKTLVYNDIKLASVGGGTNFDFALQEAIKNIYPTGSYNNKRLLFLTDGVAPTNNLSPLFKQISNEGFSIHIIGFGNNFDHLKQFVNENGSFQIFNNFKDAKNSVIKIFIVE